MSNREWSFQARQELCSNVQSLPVRSLSAVVHIIFGHHMDLTEGDDFTVDFATISDTICTELDRYISTRRLVPSHRRKIISEEIAKNVSVRADEAEYLQPDTCIKAQDGLNSTKRTREEDSPQETAAIVPEEKKVRRLDEALIKSIRGPFSARLHLQGTGACSLLSSRGKYQLIVRDDDLSLEWLDISKKTFRDLENDTTIDARAHLDDCREIIEWLSKLDVAQPFFSKSGPGRRRTQQHEPLHLPMPRLDHDLDLVKDRLIRGAYSSTGGLGFAADVRLVHSITITHCESFSGLIEDDEKNDRSIMYRAAQILAAAFEGRWQQLLRNKEANVSLSQMLKTFKPLAQDNDNTPSDNTQPPAAALTQSTKDSPSPDRIKEPRGDKVPRNPKSLIGSTICIYDTLSSTWLEATVADVRRGDGRFRVEYTNGHLEYIDLSTTTFHILLATAPLLIENPGIDSNQKTKPDETQEDNEEAIVSIQKLGTLVWAKSGMHPWWPAEICLPSAEIIHTALPIPKSTRLSPNHGPKQFVFFFGDAQFDILDTNSVVPFDSKHKPRRSDSRDLQVAYAQALKRQKALVSNRLIFPSTAQQDENPPKDD